MATARIESKPPLAAAALERAASAAPAARSELKDAVDFQRLLLHSNREVQQKNARSATHDLESAQSYQDFIEALNRNTETRNPKNTMGKDDFLRLFVTQLQNQDPLNPQDGTEMASQLAQFNSLEQMINMNTALGQLSQTAEASHSAQLLASIGQRIETHDGRAYWDGEQFCGVSLETPVALQDNTLEIRGPEGQVVATTQLAASHAGRHPLIVTADKVRSAEGDSLAPGVYRLSVRGMDVSGQGIEATLTTSSEITGISMHKAAPGFVTQLGTIGFDAAGHILRPVAAGSAREGDS